MSWFKDKQANRAVEAVTTKLRVTEDYVLIAIEDEDGYFIFNTVTHNMEDQEMKLPTALFQIDALQSALDKYREGSLKEDPKEGA